MPEVTLAAELAARQPRLLTIDIETRPLTAHVWGLRDQQIGINQIVDEGGVLCWAAKWHDERRVLFASDHHDGHDEMVRRAWGVLDEADIVVGWNHRAFDVKHLQREFVLAGLGAPTPWQDVDLLQTVRRRFRFPSNKLDHVARELGIGAKLSHTGMDLWQRCMDGDERAWRLMKRYNVQDVRLTEAIYDRLVGWVPAHPNVNMLRPERVSACSTCGSQDLEDAGVHVTATRAYERFRCLACGAYSRATHSDPRRTQHRRGV